MENKAPGTASRPGGYDTAGGGTAHENFFHPRRKLKNSIQRAGLRSGRRLLMCFTIGLTVFILTPTYLGPLYVRYVAGQDWLERARKSIWTRRNEKDYDLYMTQRKNSWWEYLGFKHYNISGDENIGPIQKCAIYDQGNLITVMNSWDRRALEKDVRETVADANSSLAQRHIRETMKKNKLASALMFLALFTPSVFLFSFYSSKFRAIRAQWRDPYELPAGFDPNTGRFSDEGVTKELKELPQAFVLRDAPGGFSARKS